SAYCEKRSEEFGFRSAVDVAVFLKGAFQDRRQRVRIAAGAVLQKGIVENRFTDRGVNADGGSRLHRRGEIQHVRLLVAGDAKKLGRLDLVAPRVGKAGPRWLRTLLPRELRQKAFEARLRHRLGITVDDLRDFAVIGAESVL